MISPLCCGEGGSAKKEKHSFLPIPLGRYYLERDVKIKYKETGNFLVMSDVTLIQVRLLRSNLLKIEYNGIKDLAS